MGCIDIPRNEFEGAAENTESRGRSCPQVCIFFIRSRAPAAANSRPAIYKTKKKKKESSFSFSPSDKKNKVENSRIRHFRSSLFLGICFDSCWKKEKVKKCSEFMAEEAGDDDGRNMRSVGTTVAHHTHHLFLPKAEAEQCVLCVLFSLREREVGKTRQLWLCCRRRKRRWRKSNELWVER